MPLRRRRPLGHRSAATESLVRLFHRFGGGRAGAGSGGEGQRPAGGDAAPARLTRAVHYGLEHLEQRCMLTTIGFDIPSLTQIPDGVIEYSQGQPGNIVRVAWHDIVAELIGVSVPKTGSTTAPTPPDVPTPGEDLILAAPQPPDWAPNLFTIYILASKPDSYLSIAVVPSLTATNRPMEPYGSGVSMRVTNAGPGAPIIAVSAGPGGVLIGQLHTGPTANGGDGEQPIWTAPATPPLGVFPGTFGAPLTAGVIMAPINPIDGTPNDIGELLIGGTVLGAVNVPRAGTATAAGASQGGNIGLFYAGAVLTGTATGVLQSENPDSLQFGLGTSASDITPSFVVGGDIRDFVVGGSIGGDPGTQPNLPQYLTATRIVVGGTVGQFNTVGGSNYGLFEIQHNPAVVGLQSSLYTDFEFEYKTLPGDAPGNAFQGGLELGFDSTTGIFVPLPPRLAGLITNDSPATAQLLGSVKESDPRTGAAALDVNGNYTYESFVSGLLQDFAPNAPADNQDWYAVPLMAGQVITVTATTSLITTGVQGVSAGIPELQLEVMDPDGRIIATDENQQRPLQNLDKPVSFRADRPGLYKFQLTNLPGVIFEGEIPYTLQVQGVGDMAVAAFSSSGDIFDAEYDKSIQIDNGDLGALLAGAHLLSDTLGPTQPVDPVTLQPIPGYVPPTPTTWLVDHGNLRVMQAPQIGFLGTGGAFGDIPYLDVPNASVGLVDATGPLLALQTRFDLLNTTNPDVPVSPVGGGFQIISQDGGAANGGTTTNSLAYL
ncbi:MAG TPA: hypothetical protein VLI90_18780, partial [Tepidisphaeraceae bacterium]|nr:hypothetical protein [Tepidisphaeraceae bacterium]